MSQISHGRPGTLTADGWCQVPNQVIRESKLSTTARTLFAILSSFSTDYDFSLSLLCELLGVSPNTYQKAFLELEQCGLAERLRKRIKGQWEWEIVLVPDPDAWLKFKSSPLVKNSLMVDEPIKEDQEQQEKHPTNNASAKTSEHKAQPKPKPPNTYTTKIAPKDRPTIAAVHDPSLSSDAFVLAMFEYYGHQLSISSAMAIAYRWAGGKKTRTDFADKMAELHVDPSKLYSPRVLARILSQDSLETSPDRRTDGSRSQYSAPGPGYENRLNHNQFVQLQPEEEKPMHPEEQRLIELVKSDSSKMPELMAYYENRGGQ